MKNFTHYHIVFKPENSNATEELKVGKETLKVYGEEPVEAAKKYLQKFFKNSVFVGIKEVFYC